jgi:ATP phosphoribosyltransferase
LSGKLRIALTKGRVEKDIIKLLKRADVDMTPLIEKGRKLILECGAYEFVLAKAPDVITYVENGVCDAGIVGKDTIMEVGGAFYEVFDFKTGKCAFCVAGRPGTELYSGYRQIKIASKYPNVARRHFNERGLDVDIIRIEGSVELAPLLGLSDGIVDLVETGSTLKENGLVVLEHICDISSRLIVNTVSMKLKRDVVAELVALSEKGRG